MYQFSQADNDWVREFEDAGALWMHDGDPARPHALLTSGLHSNGFFNGTLVTSRPGLMRKIVDARDGLAHKIPYTARELPVHWVIGSAFGAITLAYLIADKIGARAGFTEKDGDRMVLNRFDVQPHQKVLVVEDTISTGGSTRKTIAALEAATGGEVEWAPYIVCLVNRSGQQELDGFRIHALLDLTIESWPADQCPLCQAGSKALRPKSHWAELTGKPLAAP